jgi:outer membrane murein-binding lipoprotein Lpp
MRTLAIVFASLLLAGCSQQPSGPTYAEAVATYQAEVALLDSLEAKLKAEDAEHEKKMSAIRELYTKDLPAVSMSQIERDVQSLPKDDVRKLFDSVSQEAFEAADQPEKFRQFCLVERHRRLVASSKIETEIAEQRLRVEKAKSLRDAMSE